MSRKELEFKALPCPWDKGCFLLSDDMLSSSPGGASASLVSVANSALFDSANSEYLSFTMGTPTSTDIGTISVWINRSKITTTQYICGTGDGAAGRPLHFYYNGATDSFNILTATTGDYRTTQVERDTGGWSHVVLASDTTNATAGNRWRLYLNNVEVTAFSKETAPTQNLDLWEAGDRFFIGAHQAPGSYFDGYMSEFVFIDGQQLTPSSFGEADATGNYWTPLASATIKALTFGTNGFYLDNVTSAETDASGNANNFTNNNTVVTSTHTPTNTFNTWNPIDAGTGTLSNGNLTLTGVSDRSGTLPMYTGKWAWKITTAASTAFGIVQGNLVGTESTYTATSGEVVEFEFDADAGTLDRSVDGGAYSSIATGLTSGPYFTLAKGACTADFGQNGFTVDDGTFKYLNTTNIAAATTRTQSDPYEHWNNILYTGDGVAIGSGGQAITGAGFQPDFAWLKRRSAVDVEHALTDIVRGVTKELSSNDTGASETVAEGLTAFGSDGFTVGSDGSYNLSADTYVAWLAKLGGAAVSNTDGTITSSVSVNTTLGMSVGTYTGTGSAATIGHSLGVVPGMVICKKVGAIGSWAVYHSSADPTIPQNKSILLDTTAAQIDTTTHWNDTAPNSSVFTVGTSASTGEAADYVFIAFAPSEYISIGSYEGNGNADGTFVPTLNSLGVPLQLIWFMQKSIDSTSDWIIHDAARGGYNVDNDELAANTTAAEGTADQVDIVNGGIKNRIATDPNVAETNIYIAIGIPTIDADGRLLAAR